MLLGFYLVFTQFGAVRHDFWWIGTGLKECVLLLLPRGLIARGFPFGFFYLFYSIFFAFSFVCGWAVVDRTPELFRKKKMVSSSFFVFINFFFGRVKVDEAAADDDERRGRKTNKKNKK